MAASRSIDPIRLSLIPSRRLLLLQSGMATASITVLLLASVDLPIKGLLACGLIVTLLTVKWLARRRVISALEISSADLLLVCIDGDWLGATVSADSYVAPWLVVLRLRLDSGTKVSLPLMPGAVQPDTLRRLRVWLRWRLKC